MKKNELLTMTVAELKALARQKKVALPPGARKADIIKVLAKAVPAAAKKAAKTPAKRSSRKPIAKPAAKAAKKTKASPAKRRASAGAAAPKKRSPLRKAKAKKAAGQAAPTRSRGVPAGGKEPLPAQERVSDSKYFTGTPEPGPALPYDSLPREYGEERMALMARDPSMVYGYWELPKSRLEQEKKRFGEGSRLCVRIYDVTGVQGDSTKATAYFDQEVYERVGSWYFDLGRPTHSFCAELGLRLPDGRFRALLHSNVVTLPREGISDVLDEEWTAPDEAFMKLYGVPGRAVGGRSSLEVQEVLRHRRMPGVTSPGLFPKPRTKKK